MSSREPADSLGNQLIFGNCRRRNVSRRRVISGPGAIVDVIEFRRSIREQLIASQLFLGCALKRTELSASLITCSTSVQSVEVHTRPALALVDRGISTSLASSPTIWRSL